MTVVAIHQPNYWPWLGYFAKILIADHFVFLDDVQFSNGSYTNRVKILKDGTPGWLTLPVTKRFGQTIVDVSLAQPDWARRQLDTIKNYYKDADCFSEVWSTINSMVCEISDISDRKLAKVNAFLIRSLCDRLDLPCQFSLASEYRLSEGSGDDHLLALLTQFGGDTVYLSGSGGATYQDESKFAERGVGLRYLRFEHPTYAQGTAEFISGLSILDPLFRLGWSGTQDLLHKASQPADSLAASL